MGGGEIVNSAPPVSDQELQQLRGRARLVMYGLSSELRQAQVELQMPPRYDGEAEPSPATALAIPSSGSSPCRRLLGLSLSAAQAQHPHPRLDHRLSRP